MELICWQDGWEDGPVDRRVVDGDVRVRAGVDCVGKDGRTAVDELYDVVEALYISDGVVAGIRYTAVLLLVSDTWLCAIDLCKPDVDVDDMYCIVEGVLGLFDIGVGVDVFYVLVVMGV